MPGSRPDRAARTRGSDRTHGTHGSHRPDRAHGPHGTHRCHRTGQERALDPIFAKIDSDGRSRSPSTSRARRTQGVITKTYTLDFDQDVSQCAVSTVSSAESAIPVIVGQATNVVSLQFSLLSGLLTPNSFEVTVTC